MRAVNEAIARMKVTQGAQPAVRKAVVALREDSLRVEPGTLLGQEEDLIERYQVSRPTLRQAAALVGQEQLVTVRRGVGGGYFSQRPDFSGVAHMAAILLQVEGAKVEDMLRTVETIRVEMVSLAATGGSVEAMEKLQDYIDADEAIEDGDYNFRRFLKAERQHNELVGLAAGNQVLHLFMQILLELVATLRPTEDILFGKEERYLEWRVQRNKMIRAILARDVEIALVEARRGSAKIRQWLEEDRAVEQSGRRRAANVD